MSHAEIIDAAVWHHLVIVFVYAKESIREVACSGCSSFRRYCRWLQLRSGFCRCLRSYRVVVDQSDPSSCPKCDAAEHTVEHLFQCNFFPTTLYRLDLLINPSRPVSFLVCLLFLIVLPFLRLFLLWGLIRLISLKSLCYFRYLELKSKKNWITVHA